MKLNDYQQETTFFMLEKSRNFSYLILGLLGEIGELLLETNYSDLLVVDQLMKYGEKAKQIRNGEILPDNVVINKEKFGLELGDLLFLIAENAYIAGFTLEQIAEMNLTKLSERKLKNQIINHA